MAQIATGFACSTAHQGVSRRAQHPGNNGVCVCESQGPRQEQVPQEKHQVPRLQDTSLFQVGPGGPGGPLSISEMLQTLSAGHLVRVSASLVLLDWSRPLLPPRGKQSSPHFVGCSQAPS